MPTNLVSQGVTTLLNAIVRGEFPACTRLPNEVNLASYLDVSRPTMREVVRTLAERGVLEVQHGRGTFVCPQEEWNDVQTLLYAYSQQLSSTEIGGYLTQLRRMLEVGAAGLAAERITEEQLARMAEHLRIYRESSAQDEAAEAAAADVAFHSIILEATGNPFVRAIMLPLEGALHESRLKTTAIPAVRERAAGHHEAILSALRAHDPQAAKDAMRAHMTQTSEDIARHLPAGEG